MPEPGETEQVEKREACVSWGLFTLHACQYQPNLPVAPYLSLRPISCSCLGWKQIH